MDNWNTRESLLLRASDPDNHEAFEEFVYYYKNFISMVFSKLGVQQSQIDDLRQDLLIKLWKDIGKFDSTRENSNFRGWLSVVMRHEVYRFFRKNKSDKKELSDTDLDLSQESEIDQMIEKEWKAYVTSLAVEKIKAHFDGNALKVFYLTLEGKNAAAIAVELEMSENSVYVLRSRVKARFQGEIRQLRSLLENHQ
ncbi:sigma-70 family RNA polymerase sigma factor [Lentisphaera profundi]|uniref:Sigma-70 family RNA polymerase sigma factor n=1 Tax=Lentisphaera profundi TaxID=1658616 RepID=A0ABY7VVJ4_9BACT|nr:sigma-70 family RNA polymerase sigma factor [Lentisphaera profundi]WDE96912.1 sigma-70 family RNA polymerase sigma factor [Lentisphaera profundi]